MKYFITIALACLITAYQTPDDWTGQWYSPNGLIKVELNTNNSYSLHHIEGTESGTWAKRSDTIILSDSTILQIDSSNLLLSGNKLSKEKPQTSVPHNTNLKGLNFIWTFESEGIQIDTVSFRDSSYYSSFNDRSYQYRLISFNGLLFFTHNNLSNIGDRYYLVHTLNKKELILDFYVYDTKKHIKTVLRRL
ncbi:hypothetical protein QYS49_35290 [Marivirga salinae]|uniref:Uncharacterized protein n=1 Tax=Marivirga salinarum TaxID=3059078 RepID=A0AA51RAA2_9BACT|nr:hypothetical protein [Marivirga sp. BDSF4-3]WMN13007.1 hypothetical protein QYS49_35290 [Marivirga sp. BDSF4-3]